MEPANILFAVVFIVLPIGFGIWALMARRSVLKRSVSSKGRVVVSPRSTAQAPAQRPAAEVSGSQETVQIPQRDWASHVRPVRQVASKNGHLSRRRFYPPRYVGRSGGVVKRVTPRAARSFLAPRSGSGR